MAIHVVLTLLLPLLSIISGKDQVLEGHILQSSDLHAADIAIVQFDTRPLGSEYWGVAARWNYAYSRQHGHPYYYISSSNPDECEYADVKLSVVWCKVERHMYLFVLFIII